MTKLIAFNHVTLDGFFTDDKGEMSWAHQGKDDAEWNEFVAQNASGGGALLFGRVTYSMMASFWPTPMAHQMMPVVAERMNASKKFVVSRSLEKADWSNTKLIKGDLVTEIRKLKEQAGPGIAILGSGSIVSQLAEARLIDEFQVVVNPLVLGHGRTMFETVKQKLPLKLTNTRTFKNGCVLLCYEPA